MWQYLGYASIHPQSNAMFSLQKWFFQPISRDLRRELYSRQRGDGVPKRKSRKEALQKKLLQAKELQAKEGNKENQKAAPTQPVETKSIVVVKKIVKSWIKNQSHIDLFSYHNLVTIFVICQHSSVILISVEFWSSPCSVLFVYDTYLQYCLWRENILFSGFRHGWASQRGIRRKRRKEREEGGLLGHYLPGYL